MDLENTVVDESQRQLKDVGASSRSKDKYSGKMSQPMINVFGLMNPNMNANSISNILAVGSN